MSKILNASFFTRLGSGVVLVALILLLLVLGGDVLLAALSLVAVIGVFELNRVMEIERKPLGMAAYVATIFYYLLLKLRPAEENMIVMLILFSMIFLLCIYVFSFPKYKADQVMAAFFGIIYVGVMLSYVYRTRMLVGGAFLVWLIFLCSWGCDTCAYLAGITMGKHKMTPILSPKKTIEGGIGGIIGSMLLSAIFGFVLRGSLPFENAALACALITFPGALLSMVGDLAASAIKRDHSVKDYGKLIPGHGGILDRFDSVIFTAPVIYYTVLFFISK